MKRTCSLLICIILLALLCACGRDVGIIGGADGPTAVIVSTAGQQTPETVPPTTPPATEAPTTAPAPEGPSVHGDMDPFNRTWGEMQGANFWLALCEDPYAIRMTVEEIAAYNDSLHTINGTKVEKLSAWPSVLSYTELCDLLGRYGDMPAASYYTPAGRITADQQLEMGMNRNKSAVTNQNPVQYGFLTEDLIMRSFPSEVPLYDSPDTWEYDKAAETALKLWEPVLVLHTSADGKWSLVQSYDYLGWVETEKVALCDRDYWQTLCDAMKTDYLTILAPRLAMDGSFYISGQENVILKMGTILPLALNESEADNATADNCHIVLLPRRAEDGTLATYTARIPKSEDVTVGSLPFTTENLLRQVFKLLGHRYGWGGTAEGWDCSSICQDAYRTVGLFLPRNSGNQRQLPGWHNVDGTSDADKKAILETLLPGAMLELKGHQTMYIGTFEGEAYVIHATHGVYDGKGDFYNANSVIVSSVEAFRSNGKSLMANFRGFSMPAAR